jgi:hypothetical protein
MASACNALLTSMSGAVTVWRERMLKSETIHCSRDRDTHLAAKHLFHANGTSKNVHAPPGPREVSRVLNCFMRVPHFDNNFILSGPFWVPLE